MKQTKKRVGLAKPFASNRVSKFFRQILEQTKYKRVLAANIAVFTTVFNVATYPSHAFDYKAADQTSIDASQVVMKTTTERAYQFPVVQPTGISQGYGKFHPGVDIRAPKGTGVVAVAAGVVIEVKFSKVGYGHYVRIAHAGTVSSLYAHLDKVAVVVGQKLDKGQEVGTIGMTGWTTGPHLHFELNEGIKTINPKLAIAM